MKHQQARQLVETYVGGWRENDLSKILSTLWPDCIIIESHGPTYRGIDTVRRWVESWIAEGSTVDRIDSIHPSSHADSERGQRQSCFDHVYGVKEFVN